MQYEIFKEKFLSLIKSSGWTATSDLYFVEDYGQYFGDEDNPKGICTIHSFVNGALLGIKKYYNVPMSKRDALLHLLAGYGSSSEDIKLIDEGKSYWQILKDIYNTEKDTTQYINWCKLTFEEANKNSWYFIYGMEGIHYNELKMYDANGSLIGTESYTFDGPEASYVGPGNEYATLKPTDQTSPLYIRLDTIGKATEATFDSLNLCNIEFGIEPPFNV